MPTLPFPPMSVAKLRAPLLHRPRLILTVVTSRRNPRQCHSPSQASRFSSHIRRVRNRSPIPPPMTRRWDIGTLPQRSVESLISQRVPTTTDSFEDAQEPEFRPLLIPPNSQATILDGNKPPGCRPERGYLEPPFIFVFVYTRLPY